jgi:putative ABC transport system permease protein
MRATLAWAALRRHPMRTLLAVFGLAIAAALLLDMVMLATGMRASFRSLLTSQGYQLRVTPKGTLPFDTEASVGDAAALVASLRAHPEVERVSPSLGTTLQVKRGDRDGSVFALGTDAAVQGEYTLLSGREPTPLADRDLHEVVVNATFLERMHSTIGDTIALGTDRSAQLRQSGRRTRAVVVGEARFLYVPPGLPALSMPLGALQSLLGASGYDRISLAMARVRVDDANAAAQRDRIEGVRAWIESRHARVTAISTETAIVQVEERLAYFRQLAFILGALSLVIGVLLVTTLVSLSVNERLGELAVLRAIGVPQAGVLHQIMLEGLMLGVAGITLGLGLGLVTARWLNAILRDFPGLPADLDFFVWSGEAAWQSLAILLVAATVAGAIPAWRAARVRVAQALRDEAVA